MLVYFFNFSKRHNSTLQPALASATWSLDCVLKENCGVINPQIIVKSIARPFSMNYAYVPDFKLRYYFINDWTWDGAHWVASMSVDVLASAKGPIGNTTAYVLRCASFEDGTISDAWYPMTNSKTYSDVAGDTNLQCSIGDGTFVVGVVNGDTDCVGAVSYYVFTEAQFGAFKAWFMDPNNNLWSALDKSYYDPFKFITSCMWFPFSVNGTNVSSIPFGWYTYAPGSVCGKRAGGHPERFLGSFTIPAHPQAATRGSYLNSAPYSEFSFYWKPFGLVSLDPVKMGTSEGLNYELAVDQFTGVGTLKLWNDNLLTAVNVIAQLQTQIGVQIQLAEIKRDAVGMLSSVWQTATSAASADVTGALSGIASMAAAARPQLNSVGANGSLSVFAGDPFHLQADVKPHLQATFFSIADEFLADYGRPYCKPIEIKTCSGYVLCSNVNFQSEFTDEENQTIKAMLEGGIFYE